MIEKRFKKEQRDNPTHSTFISFSHTIRNYNLSTLQLNKMFTKLVDWDDYKGSSKKEILEFLSKENSIK